MLKYKEVLFSIEESQNHDKSKKPSLNLQQVAKEHNNLNNS